jgi:hypothetical protein
MRKNMLFASLLFVTALPCFAQKYIYPVASNIAPSGRYEYMDYSAKEFTSLAADPVVIITKQGVNDYQCVPNPGNPPTGNIRVYCDSGTGLLTCLTSAGASCAGSSSLAFSAITAGTNTAALVIGSGGSLGVSGTGTITATNGITQVSSLPGTCTPSSTAPVQLTASPYGIYYCSATNIWSGGAFLSTSIIDANDPIYGLKRDTVWTVTATFNGTSSVTTPASAPCFVSATDVGKKIEGTTWNGIDSNYRASTLALPETTIASVTSCHVAVVTSGTPGACAAVCTLGWGTNDDAAVDAVWAASTGNPGLCKSIWWPGGAMWIDTVHFNTNAGGCNGAITGATRAGIQFAGQGGHEAGTVFIIGSTFNLAVGTCGSGGCFFNGLAGIKLQSFGWFGLGNPVGGSQAATLLIPGIDDEIDDVEMAGYGSGDTALTCINISNIDVRWLIVDGCGNNNQVGNHVGMHQSFFGNTGGPPMICGSSAGQHVESHGSGYQVSPGTNGVVDILLNSGCNWISTGDVITAAAPTNGVCLEATAGSTAYVQGMNCDLSGLTTSTAYWAHGGKIVLAYGILGGSSQAALVDTSGLFIDATPSVTQYTGGAVTVTSGCASGDVALINCANLTAQAANINATTLFTTGAATTFNDYTLYYDAWVTTIGAGTLVVNLICPNGTATVTQAGAATVSMTANNEGSGTLNCHAAPSSAIQYSTTGFSTGAYALNLRLVGK